MRKSILIIFGVCSLIVGVVFLIFNFVMFPKNYNREIKKYSEKYNISEQLVYAIVKAESNFRANAVSRSGAVGLMQLLPETADWISEEVGVDDFDEKMLFIPEINIEFGCFYLRYLFDKFKNLEIVVCAYNAGEGVVRQWLDENGKLKEDLISYKETKSYLRKVKLYDKIYGMR